MLTCGSSQHWSPVAPPNSGYLWLLPALLTPPPTLNISSPAPHSYENLPFWSCFLLTLCSWLLVPSLAPSLLFLPHPSSHAPVQSRLRCSLDSGCSLLRIYNKTLLLNHTRKQSCPPFHCPGAPQTQLITLRSANKERTVANDIAKLDTCSPTETFSYARTTEARHLAHPGIGWKPKQGEL